MCRTVFVSEEVREIVEPPFPWHWVGLRHQSARALLDGFTLGEYITVAEDPFDKPGYAILARVAPVTDEVWDFRCFDPKPGIRIFGRFAELDTFVALTYDYRENIEDLSEQGRECCAAWDKVFEGLPPHKGSTLDAYLSGENFEAV
jgi:hypothetical protein